MRFWIVSWIHWTERRRGAIATSVPWRNTAFPRITSPHLRHPRRGGGGAAPRLDKSKSKRMSFAYRALVRRPDAHSDQFVAASVLTLLLYRNRSCFDDVLRHFKDR